MIVERAASGSLAHLLAWRLAEGPGRGFLYVEDDGPWSSARLAAASAEMTRRLASVAPGGRVVVRVGADERFLAALCAVWCRLGAAVVMHPGTPEEEVVRVVAALGAAAEGGVDEHGQAPQ